MHLVLFVVSKNGQLVYSKAMSPGSSYKADESIRLASTFHSMHAISSQIAPASKHKGKEPMIDSPVLEGINEIVADTFVLKCLQTMTGVKFLLVSEPVSARE
jgi:hypothetical protein